MNIDDAKYITFKADEFEKWYHGERITNPTPVGDAVVLRMQDKFTATALYSYAHAVWNVDDLLMEHMTDYPDSDLYYQIHALHDWAMNIAEKAEDIHGKVPD